MTRENLKWFLGTFSCFSVVKSRILCFHIYKEFSILQLKSTKMSPKTSSNFHASRINRHFFWVPGPDSFNSDRENIHSLWENYTQRSGERLKAFKKNLKIFVNQNFRSRVVTYLWERGVQCTIQRYGSVGGSGTGSALRWRESGHEAGVTKYTFFL